MDLRKRHIMDLRGIAARSFLLAFGLIACLAAAASAHEYGYDTWITANGLPQNTVTGVVQTPDGYLWLSIFDGLARFDGVRFTIFDKGNTKGILNNRFTRVFVDPEGVLWASTKNDMLIISYPVTVRHGSWSSTVWRAGRRESDSRDAQNSLKHPGVVRFDRRRHYRDCRQPQIR
jgi:ligand-binding sensor domain-containing protein